MAVFTYFLAPLAGNKIFFVYIAVAIINIIALITLGLWFIEKNLKNHSKNTAHFQFKSNKRSCAHILPYQNSMNSTYLNCLSLIRLLLRCTCSMEPVVQCNLSGFLVCVCLFCALCVGIK